MQPIDYAKAAGLAILVLMLDFAVAFLVVAFYSLAIDPGHPQAYYEAAALSITPWSTRVWFTRAPSPSSRRAASP